TFLAGLTTRLLWLEDPVPYEVIGAVADLGAPVAAGESCEGLLALRGLFHSGVRFLLPDLARLGGPVRLLQAARPPPAPRPHAGPPRLPPQPPPPAPLHPHHPPGRVLGPLGPPHRAPPPPRPRRPPPRPRPRLRRPPQPRDARPPRRAPERRPIAPA